MHAALKNNDALNLCQSTCNKNHIPWLIFSVNRAHDHRVWIWNNTTCLVILSGYGSVYSNMKQYETEIKTHIDIGCEWENMVAASVSTRLLSKSHSRRELGWQLILSATMSKNISLGHAVCLWELMILHTMFWSVKTFALYLRVPYFERKKKRTFWGCAMFWCTL